MLPSVVIVHCLRVLGLEVLEEPFLLSVQGMSVQFQEMLLHQDGVRPHTANCNLHAVKEHSGYRAAFLNVSGYAWSWRQYYRDVIPRGNFLWIYLHDSVYTDPAPTTDEISSVDIRITANTKNS